MSQKVICLIGLSGSGKSTYAKHLLNDNTIYISSDDIREELFGDASIQDDVNTVMRIFHKRMKEALQNGKSVILDKTNLSIKSRAESIQIASLYNIPIEAHILSVNILDCIERDKNRNRTVGPDVIYNQAKQFEIPFYEEGFSNIYIIKSSLQPLKSAAFIKELQNQMLHFQQDSPHHLESLDEHVENAHAMFLDYPVNDAFKLAAYWHDVGKLWTKKYFEKDNYFHYYQHENVGAYFVLSHYKEFTEYYPELQKKDNFLDFVFLINYHMAPFRVEQSGEKGGQKIKNRFGEKYKYLEMFHECDKMSSKTKTVHTINEIEHEMS